jgi:hypothetical protein
MKKPNFLKHHKKAQKVEHVQERDHSLQAQAKKRAQHPDHLHAGTAFDWEDLDAYQRELDRLDKEGPGRSHNPD